tara:strand:+ start:311 stop:598 length:288 start_codon:yes stop_codon:yes gene_type:complete
MSDNSIVCTQDFAVANIVRIGIYNADKTYFTSQKQGSINRTNILGVEDSIKVTWTGQTQAQAYFEEEGCANIQKKSGANWIGAGPATYNEAGQKQ